MRELVVSKAPLSRVASIVKDVVEGEGGVVSAHTHRSTEFDHLQATDDAWSRSGYVGTYQPFKQEKVDVRIRVWASWPRRLFRFFVYLGFAEAVLFFLMSLLQVPPPPNVWILTAIVTFIGIGVSLLTYSTSWAASSDMEDRLARHIGSEIRADEEVQGDVYTVGAWEEHRQDVIEQTVEQAKVSKPAKATTASTGTGLVSQLKRRVGRDPGDQESPEPEPAAAGQQEEPDTEEEAEGSSFRDRLPFLSSRSGQDTGEDEDAEEDAGDEAVDQASGTSLKDKLPFFSKGGGEPDQQEEPAGDEPEAGTASDDEEATEQEETPSGSEPSKADEDDEDDETA